MELQPKSLMRNLFRGQNLSVILKKVMNCFIEPPDILDGKMKTGLHVVMITANILGGSELMN